MPDDNKPVGLKENFAYYGAPILFIAINILLFRYSPMIALAFIVFLFFVFSVLFLFKNKILSALKIVKEIENNKE